MEKTLGFKIEATKLAKIDALAQTRRARPLHASTG
jgi:hypothetical protein